MALGMMLAVMGGMLVCVQNTFNAKVKERVGAWATTTLVLALGFLASLLQRHHWGRRSHECDARRPTARTEPCHLHCHGVANPIRAPMGHARLVRARSHPVHMENTRRHRIDCRRGVVIPVEWEKRDGPSKSKAD